jgi:hypothetical protein
LAGKIMEDNYNTKQYSAAAPLISGVVGFAIGFGVCWYKTKKEKDDLNQLLDDLSEQFSDLRKSYFGEDSYESFDKVIDGPIQLELDLGSDLSHGRPYNNVLNTPQDPAEIVVENQPNFINIFKSESVSMDWDYELEKENRTMDKPYILHQDEYFSKETEYSQSTLTYYSGDDILVDEQEVPIYNYKAVVGELNFGHGSDDPNVVYVRNDKLSGEYEVIKDSGLYEIEVLGNEYESILEKHDLKPNIMKFRDE